MLKSAFIPTNDPRNDYDMTKSRYYTYLDHKSLFRCILLLVPILGNVAIRMYDNRRRNNEDFMFNAVKKDGLALLDANSTLQNHEKIVLAAVQQNGRALEFASEKLQNNEKIVLAAIQQNGLALMFASKELQNNERVVLAAVRKSSYALQSASKELQNNKKIVLAAVRKSSYALQFASEELQDDKEVVLAAIQSGDFNLTLRHVSKRLQNDPDILCAIAKNIGSCLEFAKRDLVLKIVKHDGLMLKHAGHFQKNKEVVLAAICQNKLAFQYASSELQQDEEIKQAAN